MIIHPPTSGYLNPFANIDVSAHNIPHWEQQGTICFATFRLGDSLPSEKLEKYRLERELWLKEHPRPWSEEEVAEYARRFDEVVERWLDAGYGKCQLREETNRKIVENAMFFFDGKRYSLYAFVVMPNHVHVLLRTFAGSNVKTVLSSIKRFTSRAINNKLGRKGAFWQSESWDRLVRDSRHFSRIAKYIAANPKGMACSAWLTKGLFELEPGDEDVYGRVCEFGKDFEGVNDRPGRPVPEWAGGADGDRASRAVVAPDRSGRTVPGGFTLLSHTGQSFSGKP